VSVTGARPATKNDKRELFTEETTTVLLFKDGAVIQLSAAIVVGQLLFLTDKRSKREVVCQVVHKRSHRPTSCYVELEFTEPANDFWGVSFPEPAESAALPPTAEAVEAEETTEDDRSEPVEAPKSEDVAQLKDEVEALRAQLRELKEKQEEEKKALEEREAQARRLAEAEAAARAAAQDEAQERTARAEEEARRKAKQKEDGHRSLAPDEEEAKARAEARQWEEDSIAAERERRHLEQERKERGEVEPGQPEKEKEEKTNPRKFGMRLPIGAGAPEAQGQPATTSSAAPPPAPGKTEAEVTDELLPKPALDFSRAPKGLDPNDPYGIYKPVRKGPGKLEVLVGIGMLLLILGGGGFAWYKNWLPFLHRAPKTDLGTKTPPVAKPVAGAAVSKPAATPADANAGTAANGGEAHAQAAANATGNPVASATPVVVETAPAAGDTKPAAVEARTAGEPPADRSDVTKKSEKGPADKKPAGKKEAGANAKSWKNHGKAETSSESKPKPVEEAVASDLPVVPVKLLHAVQPVYPPDAMRGYITGDVRIEAVVDAQGHLGEMKVLVGPAPLRQAAMDALKQYEYAPAMQGGKAVVSKVTVTIKFWFDP
jgi:TonB family protein